MPLLGDFGGEHDLERATECDTRASSLEVIRCASVTNWQIIAFSSAAVSLLRKAKIFGLLFL